MVPPGDCYNGCCRSNPCQNGGACVQCCSSPKEKFVCHCKEPFHGKMCENKNVSSCLDILRGSPKGVTPPNGIYEVDHSDTKKKVFCDFTTPNQAWTLIESFRFDLNHLFKLYAFHQGHSQNTSSPNFDKYRMGIRVRQFLRKRSTTFRATCDFPKRVGSSLSPDLLIGYLSDYDIINSGNVRGACPKYAFVNIRGYEFHNVTMATWHRFDSSHLHIGSSNNRCGFSIPNAVWGEANFGYYGRYNRDFTCTKTVESTTQWWLGGTLI